MELLTFVFPSLAVSCSVTPQIWCLISWNQWSVAWHTYIHTSGSMDTTKYTTKWNTLTYLIGAIIIRLVHLVPNVYMIIQKQSKQYGWHHRFQRAVLMMQNVQPQYLLYEYHTAYLIYPKFSTFKVLKLITYITFTLNILQAMASFMLDAFDLRFCIWYLFCNLWHI